MQPVDRVRARMDAADLPGMLVSEIGNVRWLTGFTGSFGYVLVTQESGVFITDSRYAIQAPEQVEQFEVVTFATPRTGLDVIEEQTHGLGITKLGFEPATAFSTWDQWSKRLEAVQLVPAGEILPPLRMIKSEEEVDRIRKACKLADACFDHILRMIQPGAVEYDLGLEIEFFFRRHKAGIAFPPIVVSGHNSARPHGVPSEKRLENGDFLTLDFGCSVDGYCSDITRTVVVGKASERHKSVYARVLEAQIACIDALKVGANGKDIDALARTILDKDNLAQYFGHGLGHGLGRDVHDAGRLSVSVDQPIESGQVWTIEPGVYIEAFGGVRIEDDVLVGPEGPEVLTSSTKELLELG